MRGGSTDIVDASQSYPIDETRTEDGRYRLAVSGTKIVVIAQDERLAMEEVRRQVHDFLYRGQSAPKD